MNHRFFISESMQFNLSGFTDPKTGKTKIEIDQGHRVVNIHQDNGLQLKYIKEFSSTLNGFRIPSAHDGVLLENDATRQIFSTTMAQTQGVVPRTEINSHGRREFSQKRFFNIPGLDSQLKPGVFNTTKNIEHWTRDGETKTKPGPHKGTTQVGAWFLEILSPADDDAGQGPRELVGFGVFPASSEGNVQRFQAMAVYGNNVFEAEDVTAQATWRYTKGLTMLSKGVFAMESDKPQAVRVGLRKGTEWMSDTVKVVPTAPQVHVDEQPESPE